MAPQCYPTTLDLCLAFRTLCDCPLLTPQPFSLWSTLQPFLEGTLVCLWLIPHLEPPLHLFVSLPFKCGCVQADPPGRNHLPCPLSSSASLLPCCLSPAYLSCPPHPIPSSMMAEPDPSVGPALTLESDRVLPAPTLQPRATQSPIS